MPNRLTPDANGTERRPILAHLFGLAAGIVLVLGGGLGFMSALYYSRGGCGMVQRFWSGESAARLAGADSMPWVDGIVLILGMSLGCGLALALFGWLVPKLGWLPESEVRRLLRRR